jgi:hypothetical protein
MHTTLDRSSPMVSEPDQKTAYCRLEDAWRLNEELGAALEAACLAEPAARKLAEDFVRRRRILYVHLQANRIDPLEATRRAS